MSLSSDKITPLRLVGSRSGYRSYTFSCDIVELAADKFMKTGKGLTYVDLMNAGVVPRKNQAQDILKYHLKRGNLFTLADRRPQQYYATKDRSEVQEKIAKNTLIDPSGVTILQTQSSSLAPLSQCFQHIAIHTLEGYILPLLPEAPFFIHNMHFRTKVPPECYQELDLPYYKRNNGKHYQEIIGKTRVDYVLYANGTVDIHTICSNNPYKLETEEDRFRIIAFFGQIRAGLINLLNDKHERIIPDVIEWELTGCDLNKDIKVTDLLHFNAIKIQLKHLDHLFRIYIKAMSKDTDCRVEEIKNFKNKNPIEVINGAFNPHEKVEKQIAEITNTLNRILEGLGILNINKERHI
jgi:hypothetical protein